MSSYRIYLLGVIAVASVVAVGGCSKGAGSNGFAEAVSSVPASSASQKSSTVSSSDIGDVTKPGTLLTLGQKAVVKLGSGSKEGAVGLTAVAIEKGNPADLARLNMGDKAKGVTPYYLKFTVSNEGGTDLSSARIGSVYGQLADGSETDPVTVIGTGTFEPCDHAYAPTDFTTKGATFNTCFLTVVPDIQQIVAVAYEDGEYAHKGDHLTWKSS